MKNHILLKVTTSMKELPFIEGDGLKYGVGHVDINGVRCNRCD